jgi:4,5-dihydroxyphthalate decarboxylase
VLKLSMTCGRYDRNQALIDGSVVPEGIELDITVDTDDRTRQRRAVNADFDVCEFFMGTYMADLPLQSLGMTAIPIFVKRMFRHSYIYINKRSGITSAADLNGKRVGIQHWFTTTALWGKGLLADEYGVDLASIRWVAERPVRERWTPPAWLHLETLPAGQRQRDLLFDGQLDAGMTTEMWAPGVHPDVDFLFPNYADLERDYYRRTSLFPIMHVLLIRTSILEQHPWVAMSLYNAWQTSKERCYEWLDWQRLHQTSLWYRGLWEEERAATGSRDIYPWGFKTNRMELSVMLGYCQSQGILDRRHAPEELFHPSTLET